MDIYKFESIITSDDVYGEIKDNEEELMEFIPELKQMVGFDQKHPRHCFDLWEHTLRALASPAAYLSIPYFQEPDLQIRLALLFHDIGKVDCFTEKDGVRHYTGHPMVSSKKARVILDRIGYKNKNFIDDICYLIENHDMPISERLVMERPDLAIKLYIVQKADIMAHSEKHQESREEYLVKIKKLIVASTDY